MVKGGKVGRCTCCRGLVGNGQRGYTGDLCGVRRCVRVCGGFESMCVVSVLSLKRRFGDDQHNLVARVW